MKPQTAHNLRVLITLTFLISGSYLLFGRIGLGVVLVLSAIVQML